MKVLSGVLVGLYIVSCVAPPVDEKKKKAKEHHSKDSGSDENDIDQQAFDVEYKRYLQEVVQVLESDDEFKNRLVKANPEDIKTGKIANQLEFVDHNIRSKLDELKRQELERLRQIAVQRYEQTNGIERHHLRIPGHLDPRNPHTFEAEDLRKLIVQTTKELEDADKQRRSEFKEYEMRKVLEYQEQLKHLDEKNREEARKQHEQLLDKHKKHPSLHHPGSKQQLEQVWEEQDHQDQEFNPKTFFHLHDLDGNGVWDANEVKALFRKELDKMYDPNAPEDDIRERFEEMERMREHVFNETDTDRDQLISFKEFLDQTRRQEFERDEGWQGVDEQPVYNEDEYKNYARNHEEEIRRMIDQGLIPQAPPGYVPMIIPPEMQNHPGLQGHNVPPGMHPNAIPQGHHPGQGQGQAYHPPPQQMGGNPQGYDPQHHQQQQYGQQQYQQHQPPPHPNQYQQQQQQQFHPNQPIPPNNQNNPIPPPQQQNFQQQQNYQQPPQQQNYQQPPPPPQQQQQYAHPNDPHQPQQNPGGAAVHGAVDPNQNQHQSSTGATH